MNSRSRFCGSLESSSAGDSKKAAAARRRMQLPQYQVTAERSKMGRDRGGRCIDRDDPINDSAKTYFTLTNIPDAAAARRQGYAPRRVLLQVWLVLFHGHSHPWKLGQASPAVTARLSRRGDVELPRCRVTVCCFL